jgi:hypothetical protein
VILSVYADCLVSFMERSSHEQHRFARPGDYGSMVNEVVGTGDWEESSGLGEVRACVQAVSDMICQLLP